MYYYFCYIYVCKNYLINVYIIMELLKNTKYCGKIIFNHKVNRFFIRMMNTLIDIKSIEDTETYDVQERKICGKFRRYEKLFVKYTGMNRDDVRLILNYDDELFDIPENELARNLIICKVKVINYKFYYI